MCWSSFTFAVLAFGFFPTAARRFQFLSFSPPFSISVDLQELDLPDVGFFSETGGRMTAQLAGDLLQLELLMNDLVWSTVVVATAASSRRGKTRSVTQAKEHVAAKAMRLLMGALDKAGQFLTDAPSQLAEAGLMRSVSFCTSWSASVEAFKVSVFKQVLAHAAARLDACRSELEGLIPRWGECINDTEVRDDAARLTMLPSKNQNIGKLPEKIKTTSSERMHLEGLATMLSVQEPSKHPVTRDSLHLADNAVAFAKKTVSVAAALRVLFEQPKDAQAIKTCLDKLYTSLPKALLSRLRALQGAVAGGASSASASKRALSVGVAASASTQQVAKKTKERPAAKSAKRPKP